MTLPEQKRFNHCGTVFDEIELRAPYRGKNFTPHGITKNVGTENS